jgi:YtoQ family protein
MMRGPGRWARRAHRSGAITWAPGSTRSAPQTLIRAADVVVRFGDKYRQWNAAFDAGYAAALDKPIVTLHDTELDHALKEVDRAALATARSAEQVVDVLRYVIAGKLP